MSNFKEFLPEFLLNIKMCTNSGLSFEPSVHETLKLSNESIKVELEKLLNDFREVSRFEALIRFYNRNPSPDLNYIVKNFMFCSMLGTSLVDVIDFYLKERNNLKFEVINLEEYLTYLETKRNSFHIRTDKSKARSQIENYNEIIQDIYANVIQEHYLNDLVENKSLLDNIIKDIINSNIENGLYSNNIINRKNDLLNEVRDLCDPNGFVFKYFQDKEVSSFSIINSKQIIIERNGNIEIQEIERSDSQIVNIIERFIHPEGYIIDERRPVLSKKFIKGRTFTLTAAIPPVTSGGVFLRIDRVGNFDEKLFAEKINKEKTESKIRDSLESKKPIIIAGSNRGSLIMAIEKIFNEYFDDSMITSIGIGLKMDLQIENCLNLSLPQSNLEGNRNVSKKELQKIAESADPEYVVLDRFCPELIREFRYDILVGKLGLCLPMKTDSIQAAKKIFFSEFPNMEHLKPLFIQIGNSEGIIEIEG